MSDLIDRDYMLSQIEKAKAENRPFDYDSLIDFIKVLPNANKIEIGGYRMIHLKSLIKALKSTFKEGKEPKFSREDWEFILKSLICLSEILEAYKVNEMPEYFEMDVDELIKKHFGGIK